MCMWPRRSTATAGSTSLGQIATADNTVAVWPIPNAERLAGIALAPDGTFWLTDSEADVVHHVTLVER